MIIQRLITSPLRKSLTPDELWRREDRGMIQAWELGRRWAIKFPAIAIKASRGELPPLIFQGGYSKRLTKPQQYGSLHYYAMLFGLRSKSLELDDCKEYPLVCTKTGMAIIYTKDPNKYLAAVVSKKTIKKHGL